MAKRKSPVVHRQKLFGGRETAEEVHRRIVWGKCRCSGCGARKVVIEIRTSLLVDDLPPTVKRAMELVNHLGQSQIQPFQTPYGPAVMVSRLYGCRDCRVALERAAARGPSYALVYIDRGVGADNPVVGAMPGATIATP